MGHLRQYFDLSSHSSVIQPASKNSKKPAVLKLVELRLNGCSDQNIVLSDPLALCIFYLLKYFHNFTEFIEDIIAYLKNCQLRAMATLYGSTFEMFFQELFKFFLFQLGEAYEPTR
jgi:hypothetical protein